ncbi:methyltransferase [Spirochaetia bacterium]|nr:methyltransferase [Spirochaetia bacterium]
MSRIYHAVPGFEDHLEHELGTWQEQWGPLYYADQHNAEGRPSPSINSPSERRVFPFWQQNVWLEPFRLEFNSISEAVAALRGIQRNWAPSLHTQFRRAALIRDQLPPISAKPRPFPWQVPDAPMGAWTLLDAHTLVASPRCSSPFPAGTIEFEENKIGPPSRAYLKLWEALVRCGKWPGPGEKCLDAGASPGGWTWALARLGAQVCAVDRAPLEDRVLAMPGVTALKHDAFTLTPEDLGPMDWVFSDVICYPPRLYEWIQKWLASGLCKNFVCTIKMQGQADYETTQLFAEIPGGTVVHLYHNKHELTWISIRPSEESPAGIHV